MPSPTHESDERDIEPAGRLAAFCDDLSQFGATIGQWPEENRQRAIEILASSAEARAELEDARLVDEFLAMRPSAGVAGNLAERIISKQRAIGPMGAGPVPRYHLPNTAAMMQMALIVVVALVGLLSGRWIMPARAEYDVSGIFMICSDDFYL